MSTLPQLLEEDIRELDATLRDFIVHTDSTTAFIIDKGGFLITSQGEIEQFDLTTLAALASGAFMANQTIASIVNEQNFDSVYQQGEKHSMFVASADEYSLLVVIFRVGVSVGLVKYFAGPALCRIAARMEASRQRDPSSGLDLSVLNIANTRELFKKRR